MAPALGPRHSRACGAGSKEIQPESQELILNEVKCLIKDMDLTEDQILNGDFNDVLGEKTKTNSCSEGRLL